MSSNVNNPKQGRGGCLLVVLITLIIFAVFVRDTPSPGTHTVRPTAKPTVRTVYVVQYKVDGTSGAADVTYRNADGGTEQRTVHFPWEFKFDGDKGAFLYISAQNAWKRGSVRVRIFVNYELRKESESEGAYKIASASDTL